MQRPGLSRDKTAHSIKPVVDRGSKLHLVPIVPAEASPAAALVAESPEARVLRLESHVRLLARTLKRRLPLWIGIEADDLMQAGLMAVWLAGDLSKTALRRKIWWAMLDSVQGRQHQKLARLVSMTADPEAPQSPQYADPSPSIEQRMIAREDQHADAMAHHAKVETIRKAAADPDPLFHPLSRPEQRVAQFRLQGHTQNTTARRMHLSQQRISQLQRGALSSLRRKLAA